MIKMKINAYLASWCSQEPDKKRSHNLWRYQQVSQNGCVHNSYIQLSHKTGDSGIYIYIYIYTLKRHGLCDLKCVYSPGLCDLHRFMRPFTKRYAQTVAYTLFGAEMK